MPPKQLAVNSYGLWVKQVGMARLSQQLGHRVGLPQACKDCAQWWQEMAEEEKEHWKQKAREYKQSPQYTDEKKAYRNNYIKAREQELVAAPAQKKPVKKRADNETDKIASNFYGSNADVVYLRKRTRDLKEIGDSFDWNISPSLNDNEKTNRMRKQKFKLLSITPYYELKVDQFSSGAGASACEPEHVFPPAEVALVTFSMEEGIIHVLHRLIVTNDEQLLTDEGVKEKATKEIISEAGHRIPLKPAKQYQDIYHMRQDYHELVKELFDEMKDERFIYVINNEYNQVLGGLDWLCTAAIAAKGRSPKMMDARLFVCLDDLVNALYSWEPHSPPAEGLEHVLSLLDPSNHYWSPYDEHKSTLCKLHVEEWTVNCAQARAKKAVYGFFEVLHDEYQFNLEEDHIPDPSMSNKVVGFNEASTVVDDRASAHTSNPKSNANANVPNICGDGASRKPDPEGSEVSNGSSIAGANDEDEDEDEFDAQVEREFERVKILEGDRNPPVKSGAPPLPVQQSFAPVPTNRRLLQDSIQPNPVAKANPTSVAHGFAMANPVANPNHASVANGFAMTNPVAKANHASVANGFAMANPVAKSNHASVANGFAMANPVANPNHASMANGFAMAKPVANRMAVDNSVVAPPHESDSIPAEPIPAEEPPVRTLRDVRQNRRAGRGQVAAQGIPGNVPGGDPAPANLNSLPFGVGGFRGGINVVPEMDPEQSGRISRGMGRGSKFGLRATPTPQ